jgi:GxxExxY protein
LGNGFPEVLYQRFLAIELDKQSVQFVREEEMPIYYDDMVVGTKREDSDSMKVPPKSKAELIMHI